MVEEGRVEVATNSGGRGGQAAAASTVAVLSAGDIGTSSLSEDSSVNEFSVSTGRAAVIQTRLSWIHGQLAFSGETVGEAVREINRYGRVRFVVDDSSIAQVRIGGIIGLDQPDALVELLWRVYRIQGVEAGRDGDGIRVIKLRGARKARH
jgi:ferric-dicitrate binding protein FerR (iron transport regulator)